MGRIPTGFENPVGMKSQEKNKIRIQTSSTFSGMFLLQVNLSVNG
jgi:hypothetical protein